ncbi:hypothetical protein [Halococcus sediminicola]|uniref:hypothetical protein n=1 Tax=Halococcus sediminicola TaxID=1264579 RepID=UPI00067894E3|nr:hypothetical protein [Halococcus sediminicola]
MTRTGPIKCGDVERRRLLEELGREDCVKFIGEAAEAGRQADAGDHLGDSSDDVENADPYVEASADE